MNKTTENSMAPSQATLLLSAMSQVFPYHWSSFYTKGKLLKGDPVPTPPTLIIDLIKQCSFGCPFCFASDTQSRGRMLTLSQLTPIIEGFRGIPKVTLIGGEPFEHPQIKEIMQLLWNNVTEEVEIFTNGAAIPDELESADNWLTGLLPPDASRSLCLSLAADNCHKDRHGDKRFELLVSRLLYWQSRGLCCARFNVTDGRFYTLDYIDLPTAREVIDELSLRLWNEFKEALAHDRLVDLFYLNPLIVQGRQPDEGPLLEYLRVSDFIFNPEMVLSMDRDNKPVLLSALNAAWMKSPPQSLVLSDFSEESIEEVVSSKVVGRRLKFDRIQGLQELFEAYASGRHENIESIAGDGDDSLLPELRDAILSGDSGSIENLFEAALILHDFKAILSSPELYFEGLADEILKIIEQPQRMPLEVTGHYNTDKLGLPVLQMVVKKLLGRGDNKKYFWSCFQKLWQPFLDCGDKGLEPLLIAESRSLGRLPRDYGGPVPLDLTTLHTGFGDWPGSSDYLLETRLIIRPGRVVEYGFSSEIQWFETGSGTDSAERLLLYCDMLLGNELASELRDRMQKLARCDTAKELFSKPPNDPLSTHTAQFFSNPQTLYEYVAFDRNRNKAVYDNPHLLEKLLNLDYKGFAENRVKKWKRKLGFWLAECERK